MIDPKKQLDREAKDLFSVLTRSPLMLCALACVLVLSALTAAAITFGVHP